MISQEQTIRLRKAFMHRTDYEQLMQVALDWLKDFNTKEPYLYYKFVQKIRELKLNRAESYGFLSCIRKVYDNSNVLTDEIHDGLEPISEALSGYAPQDGTLKFPEDPSDQHQFNSYIVESTWAD